MEELQGAGTDAQIKGIEAQTLGAAAISKLADAVKVLQSRGERTV